jgi:transposase
MTVAFDDTEQEHSLVLTDDAIKKSIASVLRIGIDIDAIEKLDDASFSVVGKRKAFSPKKTVAGTLSTDAATNATEGEQPEDAISNVNKRPRINKIQAQKVLTLYNSGYSVDEIRSETKVGRTSIYNIIKNPDKYMHSDRTDIILTDYIHGKDIADIAKDNHVSPQTVYRTIQSVLKHNNFRKDIQIHDSKYGNIAINLYDSKTDVHRNMRARLLAYVRYFNQSITLLCDKQLKLTVQYDGTVSELKRILKAGIVIQAIEKNSTENMLVLTWTKKFFRNTTSPTSLPPQSAINPLSSNTSLQKTSRQNGKSYNLVMELHKKGLTPKEISQQTNLSPSSVYYILKHSQKRVDMAERDRAILSLYDNGLSIKDIQKEYGLSKQSIYRIIRSNDKPQ